MMELTDLQQWVQAQKLVEQTLERFWTVFHVYQQEHDDVLKRFVDDFDEALLVVNVENVALRVDNWLQDEKQSVVVQISLHYRKQYYKKKGQEVPYKDGKEYKAYFGYYNAYFTVDGVFYREVLNIDI